MVAPLLVTKFDWREALGCFNFRAELRTPRLNLSASKLQLFGLSKDLSEFPLYEGQSGA
jgi:hypothetical protein